jgi:tetratricopeptide (TPR) repeat protein
MALPAAEAGSALYHQDKFGEALKILRPAAAYTAKVSLYHDLASSLYFEDGDIWQQLLYYVQAYRFDDGEFAVALVRGRAMYMTQQFDWAEKSLLQAIALKPDDTTVNYFLGANYVYLKRYEKAEQYLLKGLTDPDNHGDALYQMATAQAALHRWDQAERYAAQLNREFPEFSAGWLQMAQIKDAMQRPAEVPALLERYLQLADPATPFNIEWMAFAKSYLLNVKARGKAGAGAR